MKRVAIAIVLAATVFGCANRTLTVHPDNVWSRNDRAWKIASEPATAR